MLNKNDNLRCAVVNVNVGFMYVLHSMYQVARLVLNNVCVHDFNHTYVMYVLYKYVN